MADVSPSPPTDNCTTDMFNLSKPGPFKVTAYPESDLAMSYGREFLLRVMNREVYESMKTAMLEFIAVGDRRWPELDSFDLAEHEARVRIAKYGNNHRRLGARGKQREPSQGIGL